MSEKNYLDLMWYVMKHGDRRETRNGPVRSMFNHSLTFHLQDSFPLLTSKYVHFHSIKHELLWFLKGSTNTKYLKDNKVTIWDEWADENGDLGPVYGKQWRSWSTSERYEVVDQIASVIHSLRADQYSRRHLVTAWNPTDIPDMALPPCHMFFQFYVTGDGYLECSVYMRSVDVFLGLPFNIASYALLTHMIADKVGLKPGMLHMLLGDTHVYENHIEAAELQLSRGYKKHGQLTLGNQEGRNIEDYDADLIKVIGYDPHPKIKAPVSK